MPDKCMFCWHPAVPWPGSDIEIDDAIRQCSLCEYHMDMLLTCCTYTKYPEWWKSQSETREEMDEISDRIFAEDELSADKSHHAIFAELTYDLLYYVESKISKKVLCPDKFDQWVRRKITDMARRADNGTGVHRCALSPCNHFVKNAGDKCGSRRCTGVGAEIPPGIVHDNVCELIAAWNKINDGQRTESIA